MAVFGDLMRSVAKTFDKIRGQNQHEAAPEQAKPSTELKTPAEADGTISAPSPPPAEIRSEDVKKPQTKIEETPPPAPVEHTQPEAKTEETPKSDAPAITPPPEAKETSSTAEKTEPEKEASPETAPDREALARSAVERLSEDESLRGDLSDVGFGPLLDWATAAAEAYSARAKDEAAMDDYTEKLRKVVQAAVNVAQNGKLDELAELTDFDSEKKDKLTQDLKELKLEEDADANAEQLAKILQAAL